VFVSWGVEVGRGRGREERGKSWVETVGSWWK
jgi:hypothetical protein